jgi:hypothetical protein
MVMKKLAKVFIFILVSVIFLFIELDLLISDFGLGETEQTRIIISLIFLIGYLFILYHLKKQL